MTERVSPVSLWPREGSCPSLAWFVRVSGFFASWVIVLVWFGWLGLVLVWFSHTA